MNAEPSATIEAARVALAEYTGWTKLSLTRSRATVRLTQILIVETRELILALDYTIGPDRLIGTRTFQRLAPFSLPRSGNRRNNSVKPTLRP